MSSAGHVLGSTSNIRTSGNDSTASTDKGRTANDAATNEGACSARDNTSNVSDRNPLVDLGLVLHGKRSFGVMDDLSLNGNVLSPLDNSLDGDGLDSSFRDNLGNVLLKVFDGIVVDLGDLPWDGLGVPPFLILSNGPLLGDPLSPLANLVVSNALLEGDVLNPAFA